MDGESNCNTIYITSENHHCLSCIENASYEYFFNNYLLPNVPCIIKNVTQGWESNKSWTKDNEPCLDYLKNTYGNSKITAYKCNEKYFNSQETCSMLLEEYLKYWKDYIDKEYSEELPLYYLKDWHLKNEYKDDNFYNVPIYFSSDWLNEYLTSCDRDDYRFVYMGPKGSWTPFHQDVFSSYSWSTNICGKKRWLLFPPGEEKYLLDDSGNLPYDIKEIPEKINYFEVIQHQGDALFVPSGWYHQVWNLENTISINHNWINGCNIEHMWKALEYNLLSVKKEISDCEDMEDYVQQCQLILKATFGMDFDDFFSFLQFIAQNKLEAISSQENVDSHYDRRYIIFDLNAVKDVMKLFKDHRDVDTSPELMPLKMNLSKILNEIMEKLEKY